MRVHSRCLTGAESPFVPPYELSNSAAPVLHCCQRLRETNNVVSSHTSSHVHRIRSGRYTCSNLSNSTSEAQTELSGVNSQNTPAICRRHPCSPGRPVSVQTLVRASNQSAAKAGKTRPEHRRPCAPYGAPTRSKYGSSHRPDNLAVLLPRR